MGRKKHLLDVNNWYGITKDTVAEAAVYHYGKRTDYTIHFYDPSGVFEDHIEAVLSHESLHLALRSVMGQKTCSALDNIEHNGDYRYSYPRWN